MMYKYFRFPFATSGDKSAVPDAVQLTGAVSYEQGWGPDYQLNPKADPAAKNVPRQSFNQILGDITGAIRDFQTVGVPDWIEPIQNGGSPYAYAAASLVRYDDGTGPKVYHNTVGGNTNAPTGAGWEPASFSGGNTTATVTLADDVSVGDFVAATSAGQVQKIKEVATAGAIGAPYVFSYAPNAYTRHQLAYDQSNGKVLFVFSDVAGATGAAHVGTMSGTSITYGSEYGIGGPGDFYGVSYDVSAGKFLIAYRDTAASNIGKCVVATVSGTTVTFGTPVTFSASAVRNIVCEYCPSAGVTVISYLDNVSLKMQCIPAHISGTTITLGTAAELTAAGKIVTGSHGLAYDAASSKVLLTACDTDNSGYPFGCVLTVSASTITYGTPVVFGSVGATAARPAPLSSADGLAVVTSGSTGIVRRATITGTAPAFGAPVEWSAAALTAPYPVSVGADRIAIYYNDMVGAVTAGYPTCITVLYNGDGFRVAPALRITSNETVPALKAIAYNTADQKSAITLSSPFSSASYVYTPGEFFSNFQDVIGVALEDKLAGQSCRIVPLGGIDTTTTGLSIGQDYYITGAGVRTTTAGTNVYVGRAVAPDQLLLRSVAKR